MSGDPSGDRSGPTGGPAETLFYLSLMVIGFGELVFHSRLPRWATLGGIPVMLIYVITGFVIIRRRRSRPAA